MLRISKDQMADFRRHRRQSFIDAQLARLRTHAPTAFACAFSNEAVATEFIERLLAGANAAGVDDCANLEALLDTCFAAGWVTPTTQSEAGVDVMLADPARSAPEKVTRIVNAAAFAAAAALGREGDL